MKIQIKNVSSHQTSKVFAIMFSFMALPFAFIGIFSFLFAPTPSSGMSNFPFLLFAFAPIFYGLIGYLFNRLFCLIYNFISKRFGGIEFVAEEQ